MAGALIALDDCGVRFRMWRRNRSGHRAPRLAWGEKWRLWGLRHVTVDVGAGETLGIIGANGAGKTTLLKLVAGVYRPDEGTVEVGGRVAPLLSAAAGLLPGLTGWDNLELTSVLLGLSRSDARRKLPEMAEFSNLGDFLSAPVRTYSAGMKARLGFAASVHSEPDVVLLDEIMAVGDRDFRRKSRDKIRELAGAGCAVLMTTHEVETIVETAQRVVHLEKGEIVEVGPAADVVGRYLARRPPAGEEPPRLPRAVPDA